MIRDVYLSLQLRLHLPAELVVIEAAPAGEVMGQVPVQPIHVITAHNPHGREASEGDNRRAHRELLAQLDSMDVEHHPAAGADPKWLHVEPSVAVLGISRPEAVELGRRFQQEAIFEWDADALTVVSCTSEEVAVLGWRQIEPDERAAGADRAWRELALASPYEPLAVANSTLDRALEAADRERAGMLNDVFLQLAADYWAPRLETEQVQQLERESRQRETERAAARAQQAAEERREQRRALQAAARRRNAAQHNANVEAGWPKEWRPRHVEKWMSFGGDRDLARSWGRVGWAASEVLAAANAVGDVQNLPDPPAAPEDVSWWGDTLTDLALGRWPLVPRNTRVSVKRSLPDGRRERWFVTPDADGGVRVERSQPSADPHVIPPPWVNTVIGHFPTIEAALAAVPELSTVSRDVVCELNAARDSDLNLLEHLRVPRVGVGRGAEGVDEEAAAAAGLDLDEIARLVEGAPSRLVHCTVDGQPVVAVRTSHGWQWLTVGEDEIENGGLVGETLVEYRWFSESGGAPVSWDGGGSIGVVAPKLAVMRQWGDLGDSREFVSWPASARGRAGVVARWITESDLETVAALVLEPWPDDEQWLVWYDVSISLDLGLDVETRKALRRHLARNSDYATARDAIRHPDSKAGRELAAALEQASATGFTGNLYRLQWLSDHGEATR